MNWVSFGLGVISVIAISGLAVFGWWFLIITRRGRNPKDVSEEFTRVRNAIRQAWTDDGDA